MSTKQNAVDYVLVLSAQNGNGQSMTQAARKGASRDAIDNAAKIYCDDMVRTAIERYQEVVNSRHNETSASHVLHCGTDRLKELSQIGLSQGTKDYILRAYLSVGILREVFYVAKFGASPEAIGELRKAMIDNGDPYRLKEVAELQCVPLSICEIDALVSICIKKYMSGDCHTLIKAVSLGASRKMREHAAREFVKERLLSRRSGRRELTDWEVLLQILGDAKSAPKEVLNEAIKMLTEEVLKIGSGESSLGVERHERICRYVEHGVKLVRLGPSPHVADFFVQELLACRIWSHEDAHTVAHRCSPMFAESLTQCTFHNLRVKRHATQTRGCYSQWDDIELMATLKKLAQIAKFASVGLRSIIMEELLNSGLTDEAIELASVVET